ncbi:hypothetical protein WR25_08746 isoform B [Diploscapter pachys]|uniref:Cytochrome P450 n=1 Tax=Diploscapter pachys TaxID=2018661 RepID=A0A2A2KJE6_9BILA|nr:hypothetical protein WR25_08746 isoform B [Diploscapter pachys]
MNISSEWKKIYGPTFGIYEGLRKMLITSDLDIINEVFVKQFDNFHGRKTNPLAGNPDTRDRAHVFLARGARWKRLRTITSPSFSNTSLKKIYNLVEDSAVEMTKLLEKKANTEINIREYYHEYTMDIIARVALGQRGSLMFNNPLTALIVKFVEFDFRGIVSMLAHCTPLPIQIVQTIFFLTAKIFRRDTPLAFVRILETIGKAIDDRVKQREEDEKRGIERGEPADFIDMYLDVKVDDLRDKIGDFSKNNVSVSKNMTYQEIKGQLLVFLIAGFDTTANSLSYTSYLLAKHPDKMKKLQEEIDRECAGTTIDYDALGKLKYLEAVFKETLRMYPLAASVNSRQCMKSTTIGDMEIEEGAYVCANTWDLHYDKKLWGPDADEFVPERWLNGTPHPPGAYMPFGAGPRICIGMRLAYIEEKLALCYILRKFDMVEGPNTGEKLKIHGSALVHPDYVKKYGKTFGMYEGLRKYLVTSDMNMITEVFMKQFDNFHARNTSPMYGDVDTRPNAHIFVARGHRWKRLRTIANPSFSSASLRKIHGLVEDSAMEMVKHLENKVNDEIDIRVYFQEFTIDIIGRLAMGQKGSQMFNNPLLPVLIRYFEIDYRYFANMLAYCTPLPYSIIQMVVKISSIIFKDTFPFLQLLAKIGQALDDRIKQREEDKKRGLEPSEPTDFIDLFLDAKVDEIPETFGDFSKININVSKTLTYEEIKGQLAIFLIAGFDTTANSLSYASFLLAKNPDKLKKLQEEIDREYPGTTIDYDTLGKLKYLDAVFKETLRLYPVAGGVNIRLCMKSTKIGNMQIEEGTFVQANTWEIHHDKEIYGQDADNFIPERWLNGPSFPPCAYQAFGMGPRICIGMRLAYMEEKLALCHILRKFDITGGPNSGVSYFEILRSISFSSRKH